MGTMLQSLDLPLGTVPEQWNLDEPDVIRSIHTQYIEAGAQVIETNTFGGNAVKLKDCAEDVVFKMNAAGAKLAKSAALTAAQKVLVAGSIGPTGELFAPWGSLRFQDAVVAFTNQAAALATGGADFLLIETMMDLQEARAAYLGARSAGLPVVVQLTFQENGRTLMGTPPSVVREVFKALGAMGVGANCGTGPKAMFNVLKDMAGSKSGGVSAFPNAGLPIVEDGEERYPMQPDAFAVWAEKLAVAGADLIGGCCGTTPAHIQMVKTNFKKQGFLTDLTTWLKLKQKVKVHKSAFLAGRTRLFAVEKSRLAQQLRNWGSIADVSVGSLSQSVQLSGNNLRPVVLEIPKGVSEAEIIQKTNELQMVDLPMVFAAETVLGLETALTYYCGRAGVLIPDDQREKDFTITARTLGALPIYL